MSISIQQRVATEPLRPGQRLIYWPSTSREPEPCEVVRELDRPGRYGDRVVVRLADSMSGEPKVVYTRSLYVPGVTCRVCGCIDEWACEGGCWWVEPDLCSSCVSDRKESRGEQYRVD